jgi:hypothetical protein
LASPGPKYIEALLKEFLELGPGATLEKHVPVRAGNFSFDQLAHNGLAIDIEENALVAGLGRLPDAGNFSVSGKNHFKGLAIGRTVCALFPRGKLDTLFAL